MGQRIEHRGIVESVSEGYVYVRTERKTACSECHAKGICGEQGTQRLIKVATPDADKFAENDNVIVALESSKMALSAIIWAYILPLIVLLGVLIVLHKLGFEDGVAALASIIATAIYYALLYAIKGYFDRKIKFTIIKE